ncbi:MAG: hypothetical protein HN657_01175 [Candidatus Marinimicrobia bacterium]|jgi:hypothetical protein|nr:hypothetical protein [Candidatus Neomarinimicrobiota bacterium]MBT3496440.1 hypothetical protein [Candidatus Neomarinimicrobiota bacterium]MBT3691709.1 hypothetical protein [Candidatus Neomarinimicrobiota bacterium]MBT4144326.1 hypothetical protein [Candidatus Neomarinimicrobiota bacterium]MBT4177086.1 hypothetical protein [Candidatus Neomarinimicrobiota bacterium]
MAHAYTPGLKVLHQSEVEKNRRLPIKGEVLKEQGDNVLPNDIVAKTDLPGNVQMVKVSNLLNIGPGDIHDAMIVKNGVAISKGQIIAEMAGLFGLFKSDVKSPIDGTLESVSDVTGVAVLREAPIPVEVDAYMSGSVKEIIPEEGVVIGAKAAFIQGIFGIGGESRGEIVIVSSSRDDEIKPEMITTEHEGKIIVGGSFISLEAYQKARAMKVAGVVVGGFNYFDLEALLGYTLGVAITGTESLGTSLVLTEGYGKIQMSDRTFSLLKEHENHFASINGATQIRAGVIRPEIVIPLDENQISDDIQFESQEIGIDAGSLVRIIRAPYFGKIGKVTRLPSDLEKMESETMVRVAEIEVDGEILKVPRSNLEMLETN